MPSRSEVRRFGRTVQRGDRFVNRFEEHGTPQHMRELVIERDVPRLPLFVLRVTSNPFRPGQVGKVTTMRTRTLMTHYRRV